MCCCTRHPSKRFYLVIPMAAAVVSAYAAYLLTDYSAPLVVVGGEMAPMEAAVGDAVVVRWRVRRTGAACELVAPARWLGLRPQLQVQREFWDWDGNVNIKWSYTFGKLHLQPDDPTTGYVDAPVQTVPPMLPGHSRYRVILSYECNWLRRLLDRPVVVTSPFLNFDVVKR